MSNRYSSPPPNGYDLNLFEKLNEEYLAKPLVPKPGQRTPAAYSDRARNVLSRISKYVEIQGKNVLELGCGQGWLTSILVAEAGANQATGIDIAEGEHWKFHEYPRTSYLVGDLSQSDLVPHESIDLVLSAVVFEHVRRPLQMLSALNKLLRPGGIAWLYFNLYRGPKASHVYRQVFFPWPHLLFDDAICVAYYKKHHDRSQRFSWVNKLTAADYTVLARNAGFETNLVELSKTPIDIPFYCRFEDRLGRYPALDLESDFMTMVLKKSTAPADIWPLDYLASQEKLDQATSAEIVTSDNI